MSFAVIGLFLMAAFSATLMVTAQKLLVGYSPYRIYTVANGVAFALSLLAYLFLDNKSGSMQRNPWMIALGIALVLLNLCYVRLYQQDINLSYVPLIVTGLMTILALVVGYFFFQESFSRQSIAGIFVVGVGLFLLVAG